jgi:hypothetical protein
MKEYDIVIVTTSLTRPDLHNETLIKVPPIFDGLTCKWLINIDLINGSDVESTKENILQNIQNPNIDIEFFVTNEMGGTQNAFFNSAKRLINEAVKITPKVGYYWLEDDYFPCKEHKVKDTLQLVDGDSWYISYHGRNELNFNPGLWSTELFHRICVANMDTDTPSHPTNPERTCVYKGNGLYTHKEIGQFKSMFVMDDLGREWQRVNLGGKRTFNINS